MILYWCLFEDLEEVLVKSSKGSLHDLVLVLVIRCCRDPAEEVLADALRWWCLYESSSVLVRLVIGSSCMKTL